MTALPGLILLAPRRFEDDRGYFRELWNLERAAEQGLPETFVQTNHSRSERDVLRGLHFQRTHPQGKCVTVVRGDVLDVVVDLRPGSPTFGQSAGFTLGDSTGHGLYVPPGFAHGFLVLSDVADVVYQTTAPYRPQDEGALRWDDPSALRWWPAHVRPRLSAKDAAAPSLSDLGPLDLPRGESLR
ncbi:MAG: dTDP-4-dehydrorhamnose 3,5-epimerase [Bradymonadia bacterium]